MRRHAPPSLSLIVDHFRKLVIEDVIRASSLTSGEECWISNGVRGFIYGKIRLQ